MLRLVTMLAVLIGLAIPALAQSSFIGGTLTAVEPGAITLRHEAGASQRLALAPNLLVMRNVPATLADIHPNDFVASAATPGADGKLHSIELRIFPEALRGVGEGQRPMAQQGQTMTNATVTGAVLANGSNTLKVSFRGGESELVVDPGVPVTRIEPADRAALAAGAKVRAQRGVDGSVMRITISQ